MKTRGGKREGARQKKSPALTKIMRKTNQKHWRANHHLWFVTFVHLPFSVWSLDYFCCFTRVYQGHLMLCYTGGILSGIEPLDRVITVMANNEFCRS